MDITGIEILRSLVSIELEAVNEGWQIGSTEYAERLQTILNELNELRGE
jgi:hypothetical protein